MVGPTSPSSPVNPLFVPALEHRRGTGHLRRCLDLARQLGGTVYWPEGPGLARAETWAPGLSLSATLEPAPGSAPWTFAVIDQQASSAALVRQLRALNIPLIGLDEGGAGRRAYDILVDIWPNRCRERPNLHRPEWAELGPRQATRPGPRHRVLAVFGGADPAGLGPRFFEAWFRWSARPALSFTWILPPGLDEPAQAALTARWPELTLLPPQASLAPLFETHDLVLASFGRGALEAREAGLPVLTLDPSSYHQSLARDEGFLSLGVGRPDWRRWPRDLDEPAWFAPQSARREALPAQEPGGLAEWLANLQIRGGRCPACAQRGQTFGQRHPFKSYFPCPSCSWHGLSVFGLPPKEYSEAYFFEQYKAQYGRTYLDDFDHIRSLGRARLEVLEELAGRAEGRRLLDVGCAYGPFLVEAQAQGWRAEGVDIAPEAVNHVRSLGFEAWAGPFEAFQGPKDQGRYHVATAWYVIEHFPDLRPVLQRFAALVEPGGYLALGTPQARGTTGLWSPERFFKESPDDHFSLWNPRAARKVLARVGFKVVKIRPTGAHPERLPWAWARKPWGRPLAAWLCRVFGWSDTFEIYARREDRP